MSLSQLRGIWRGRTIACLASGPSLTAEDAERVRAAGMPAIVVNTTWRIAPWADILYAMDAPWWKHYGDEVLRGFKGRMLSYVRTGLHGVHHTKGEIFPMGWGNSGSYAISVAVVTGAARVLLLGYDCSASPDGRAHWHDDHPKPMGNAMSMETWPKKFSLVATYAQSHGCRILNCSRATALMCFERASLENELGLAEVAAL